jgi:SAM-dependent methyltransferase
VEPEPSILDLMAGADSYIPDSVRPAQLIGLGLDERLLRQNDRLDRYVLLDLNKQAALPFESNVFDVVLNTISVDYITKPVEIFGEVARVLKPGGLFVVTFTNRVFPEKAVQVWRGADETTRQLLVEEYFRSSADFGPIKVFSSRGKPRPSDDRYAGLGIPSDPVWIVYAEKRGAPEGRVPRPDIEPEPDQYPSRAVIEERKARVFETLRCPYCECSLEKFDVPQSPFCEWPNDYVYVCFNNDCPYLIRGWDVMAAQGNPGFSYRLTYNPVLKRCMPAAIPSAHAERTTKINPRG